MVRRFEVSHSPAEVLASLDKLVEDFEYYLDSCFLSPK